MKKILFYLSSLGRGGAERVVVNLSRHFIEQQYSVTIVTEKRQEQEYEVPEGVVRINLADEAVETKSRIKRITGTVTGLRKVFQREAPDLIISFMGKANLKAIVASTFLNIPVVVSVRADPREEYKGWKNRTLAFTLFRFAKGVIFQTEMARDYFPKAIREKSVILLNPINADFIRESFAGPRQHVIVTAGRLDANKNHRMLIDAFCMIKQEYPELCVKIYGDGEDKAVLAQYIREKQVEDKVILEGQVSNILDKIYQAEVFVLCSDTEGMPNALLEAMAAGVPVISTDCPCGAPAMFIKHRENGMLVPVNDAKALAEALGEVLGNPRLAKQMGQQATHIARRLAPEVVYQSWREYVWQVEKR